VRINKFLASCNVGSRRAVEAFVTEGRVMVNGVVAELSSVIQSGDTVTLDGKVISLIDNKVYIVMNKPCGYLTTCSDDRGRKTVMDLLPKEFLDLHIFPVGRLDMDTSGLLVLSNDGDFANDIMHPSMKVQKTYIATVDKDITDEHLNGLLNEADEARKLGTKKVEIIIHTGKNRQVRKMLEAVGLDCVTLHRTRIGKLSINGMKSGEISCHDKPIDI